MAAKHKKIKKPVRKYVKQQWRIPTVSRPLASKYGDELFVKIEKIQNIQVDTNGDAFLYMR